jgi:hypothetical protein
VTKWTGRTVLATIVAATAVMAASGTASAADDWSGGCEARTLERPFLPWLDPAAYTMAPGGSFERHAGWKLENGARVVSGNEPYKVSSSTDSHALFLGARGSATSPWMCVHLLDPTVRLFVKNSGSPLSLLKVEVLFRDPAGLTRSLPVGLLPGLGVWEPSLPVLYLENATQVLSLDGLTTRVAFRFTPTGGLLLGNGSWTVDDVYVDPLKLH